MTFRQQHLSYRTQGHQHHWHQRGPDADAKARHFFFGKCFLIVQTFRNRLVDAFQETGVDRAGQYNGRDTEQRTVEQGFAHIRMENSGDSGRAWVRRQEAVGNGKRGRHRDTHIQQWDTGCCCDSENQRQ